MSDNCIFCKIAAGEIPARKVYEDSDVIAFHDIHPAAPVHFMIVPKEHIVSLADAHARHEMLLGRILLLAPILAKEQGLHDGFRTIINTGKGGGQEVMHLHVHIMGGGSLRAM
jgi:histidine triad (HIT) family protein